VEELAKELSDHFMGIIPQVRGNLLFVFTEYKTHYLEYDGKNLIKIHNTTYRYYYDQVDAVIEELELLRDIAYYIEVQHA